MAPASLEGDGINTAFFHLLWNKDNAAAFSSSVPLRIPDTVVFQYGQPLHWYFTSKRGGKDGKTITILRKRKQNVTIEKIEELFLQKSSTRGVLGDHDVVAYFIASADCTSRFRRHQSSNDCNDDDDEDDDDGNDDDSDVNNTTCDIEYFDREGLKAFLAHGRKNQTGILQRFMQPAGGGTHNELIQAIWTPNLCLMERRRTKPSLHDTRFGLYERTVTFEGPGVHSTSKPIRGAVLGNKIKHLCNEMVRHVSDVSGADGRKRSRGGSRSRNAAQALAAPVANRLTRMVVYFKVDINDDIWVLFTSSLRLDGTSNSGVSTIDATGGTQNALQLPPPTFTSTISTSTSSCSAPLNINPIIKLGPNIKLNPKANHDPNKKLDNEVVLSYCPSCGLEGSDEHFYPVPYKTIISQFEHAIDMMKDELGLDRLIEWPPDRQLIEAAGGVGFGSYNMSKDGGRTGRPTSAKNAKAVSELPEEDTLIPPVIRQIHGRLKAQGYRRYRSDPLFLHRNGNVCEHCFLSYAQLASTSFQMINPIRIDEDERRERLSSSMEGRRRRTDEAAEEDDKDWSEEEQEEQEDDDDDDDEPSENHFFSGHFDSTRIHSNARGATRSIGMLLSDAPTLPPVILEPPADSNDNTNDCGDATGNDVGATRANAIHASLPMTAPPHPPVPLEAIKLDDFLAKHMAPSLPPPHPYQQSHGNARHPLQHLITSYELMERAKSTQSVPSCSLRRKQQQNNPYEVSQRIADPRGQARNSKPTKSSRREKTSMDAFNEDKEAGPVHAIQSPTSRRAKKEETSTCTTGSDGHISQTLTPAAKISAEDKQLLTSALSDIYEKQREMTLSQSQLLIPESL